MNTIINCLELRMKGYEKAIAMVNGEIPWENGYNWPTYPFNDVNDKRNVLYWKGCIKEIRNTLDMVNHYFKKDLLPCYDCHTGYGSAATGENGEMIVHNCMEDCEKFLEFAKNPKGGL